MNGKMYTATHTLLLSSILLCLHEKFFLIVNECEIVRNYSQCQLLLNDLLTIIHKFQNTIMRLPSEAHVTLSDFKGGSSFEARIEAKK